MGWVAQWVWANDWKSLGRRFDPGLSHHFTWARKVYTILNIFSIYNKFTSQIRWILVGTATFIIDYFFFILLYSFFNSVFFANSISSAIAIGYNYFAHYHWSFKSKSDYSNSSRRYLVNLLIFWSIGTITLKYLIDSGTSPQVAKVITVPVITPLSYLSLKYLVFRK